MAQYLRLLALIEPTTRSPSLPLQLHGGPHQSVQGAELTAPRLRRMIGKALVEAHCPFGATRCQPQGQNGRPRPEDHCSQAMTCPYGVLFAASRTRRPPFAIHLENRPGRRRHRAFPARLELTLYDSACESWIWLLAALRRALTTGLGRKRVPWRIRRVFRITPDHRKEPICGSRLIDLPPQLPLTSLPRPRLTSEATGPLIVRLASPTRFLKKGRLLPGHGEVSFDLLVARILDRLQGLYGDSYLPREERRRIEAEAKNVQLLERRTHWREVSDYSARNANELHLGGLVGRLHYSAPAERFLPILRAGEVVHVGKNPTSGCGRIQVSR